MSVNELSLSNLKKADNLIAKEIHLMESRLAKSNVGVIDKELRNDHICMLKQSRNFLCAVLDIESFERKNGL